MRVFDVADGVEFCTLAHNLTSAPNWVKQFTTVVVMQTLTTRRSRDLQKKNSLGEIVRSSERSSTVENAGSAAQFRLERAG